MKTIEDIVLDLSNLLETEHFDSGLLDGLITNWNEQLNNGLNCKWEENSDTSCHSKIIFFDFEYYSEEKLTWAQQEKAKAIDAVNFELAANMRELEKECLKYIALKNQCGFYGSAFVLLHNFIIYAYFGTAKNDQRIRKSLNQENGFKDLNISYLLQCLKQ